MSNNIIENYNYTYGFADSLFDFYKSKVTHILQGGYCDLDEEKIAELNEYSKLLIKLWFCTMENMIQIVELDDGTFEVFLIDVSKGKQI